MSVSAGSARSEVTTGLVLMLMSVTVSPVIDIFSKLAVDTVPAVEITAARFAVQALCMLPFALWRGSWRGGFSWRQSLFHLIRGALVTVSMICFVTTLRYMAVADAIAIFFVEPIILTVMSGLFLKETIGWRRYGACAVGFAGALLIIQPSFSEVGPVALLPVVTAFCIAAFAMMTRLLSRSEDAWSMQLQMGLWGLVICAVLLATGAMTGSERLSPVMPDATSALFMLGVGLSAALSGILGVNAYRLAPASTLAPLQYWEIVSATGLAWLVFGDFPDALKWLGIAIIVASGFYILWRERRVARPLTEAQEAALAP